MNPVKFVKFRPKPLLSDANHAYVENLKKRNRSKDF